MVYCPQADDAPQLYVVKRQNAEEYESGHSSSIGPKLYLIGNAKSVAKKNNRWLEGRMTEEEIEKYLDEYYGPGTYHYEWFMKNGGPSKLEEQKELSRKRYLAEIEKGPWIVAPAVVSSGAPLED